MNAKTGLIILGVGMLLGVVGYDRFEKYQEEKRKTKEAQDKVAKLISGVPEITKPSR